MNRKRLNVAVDGHSSSGKSTLAQQVARAMHYMYIDTGAMYRAATLFAMKERLVTTTEVKTEALEKALDRMYLQFRFNPASGVSEIHLNGANVEREIRTMEVAKRVSLVAAVPAVRKKLVTLQQRMAEDGGVVMDGRDIGTVVMPDAEVKFFLTASPEVRAQRRLEELVANGKEAKYEEVLENLLLRDRIDSTRATSPLRQADDAVVLDNSELTLDEQFDFMVTTIRKRLEELA
jgi:cytidylate kinase